jgi:hypothetical protein
VKAIREPGGGVGERLNGSYCIGEIIIRFRFPSAHQIRYERELNQAKRPALRLISTQDAAAALPMNLSISNIFNLGDEIDSTFPELEVTDGWYRLKARIDAPMARAVKRGIISIGRKIGVAGARVSEVTFC